MSMLYNSQHVLIYFIFNNLHFSPKFRLYYNLVTIITNIFIDLVD